MTNDNFINSTVITGQITSVTGTNLGFTGEPGEPSQSGTINSAWWRWTAPTAGPVTINTVGSNFDTYLAVFTGDAVNNLTLVIDNDDFEDSTSQVTFFPTAGTTYHIAVDGFLSNTGNIQLNLAQILSLSEYNTPGFATAVQVVGDYAYVADGSSGLQILNITNPSSPTLTASYDTPDFALGVQVVGNYAYVADGESGLQIINITNPSSPTLIGSFDTPDFALGVQVVGNYAYVADGDSGLQILNITNPSSPSLTASYDTPDFALGVQVVGNYAYVADGESGLQIINITNPFSPTLTASYDTPGSAEGVQVVGNYAYVADGESGLQILNITNPSNPTLTASYDTPELAYGVQVVGNYAYVADDKSGLQIINITNPSSPSPTKNYQTPNLALGVQVVGDYAYVADGLSGLQIFDVSEFRTLTNLAIAPTNATPLEGDAGLTPFTFTVTRTGDTTSITSATWAVTGTGNNPANAGDFGGLLPSGRVDFASGETTKVITVNVTGDTLREPDETFTVTLSDPSSATITTATATGTIRNDDLGDRQQITSLENLTATPGGNVSIPLFYKTSTGDNTLTGISLRLHYNSNELSFQNADNLFNNDLFVPLANLADSRDFDNDPQSDRYIQFGYTNFAGNWPNQPLPLKLGNFKFTTTGDFEGTQLKVTSDNLAPGYSLEADPIFVGKQAWNLDIDGDGEIKALSDGIMIVRYLFGPTAFPDDKLIEGAVPPNATRNLAEIQAYLQKGVDDKHLDIDGDGEIKALSDGIMIVRHLFGPTAFPGDKLIEGAIAPDATRDLTQIQAHLTQFSTLI
ncbi:Calx-beta domain-containing protein [Umezakia ovalisporum]|uniref:Calx-beta domain-containing protein n=1 Tax=Umezakia ovalisporum TaxID=75695 RepID=UPI000A884114|nr:hypothetical protein [Umezakia ovalisporum]MDH6083979.1 hypothetical protein [Umezakia ovalisporum TAC611]